MENVKKHPSLPPNYVTIADLKQRWLKQKQQQKEEAEEKERQPQKEEAEDRERQRFQDLQQQQQEEEKQHQRGEPVAVVRTRSAPGTRNVKRMQFRSKIRTDSGTNSRWIAVTRDGNAELDNKGTQSKKKKKNKKKRKSAMKRNPKVEEKEKETSEESESEISEAKKSTIESGLNEVKKNVKQNPDVEEEKKKNENEAIEELENSEAKKSTSETELNGEKKDDSIVEEIEEKFGGLSVNAGNGKQFWRIKRVNEGFGHSQPVRTNEYYFGGRRHGFSRRYDGFGRHNDKGKKEVWVRKGDNDNAGGGESGEIEA